MCAFLLCLIIFGNPNLEVLKITFLGTGTSQGVPVVACQCKVCCSENERDKRLRSSVLIETEAENLVIDAGPDFRQQMLRVGLRKLDAILLTHEHYDHIAGLDDIRAFNWVEQRPTDIYAEPRVQQSIERIFHYVFASKKYPGIPQMNLHTVHEGQAFQVGKTEVVPIRAFHYKLPVLGFRVGNFAYLTDIKTIAPEEIERLKGVTHLVVNALRREEHISHFTVDQALEFIAAVGPQKAYLTHIGHQLGLHETENAQLPNGVELAYDGLVLDVNFQL